MQAFRGDTDRVHEAIAYLEAKEIFDKKNFTKEDETIMNYLRDLNSIYEVLSPKNPKDKKTACIFDCRPDTMPQKYGFAYKNEAYFKLENAFIDLYLKEGITEVWTDLSQGFSIAAANAVIRMKRNGFDMTLNVAIPYKGHGDQIYGLSKAIYDNIKANSTTVVQVSDQPRDKESFKNGLLYIINKSNVAICCQTLAKNNAYFLNYCKNKNVEIIDFDLKTLKKKD